jgi:hypothetical protein
MSLLPAKPVLRSGEGQRIIRKNPASQSFGGGRISTSSFHNQSTPRLTAGDVASTI